MDYQVLVQNKLIEPDKCVFCLIASLGTTGNNKPHAISIIESFGDHGLLVYVCTRKTPNASTQLALKQALPITADFKFSLSSQTTSVQLDSVLCGVFLGMNHSVPDSSGYIVPVRISSQGQELVVELPQDQAGVFLTELKKITQELTQNQSFGIEAGTKWLEKYTNTITMDMPQPHEVFTSPENAGVTEDWALDLILQSQVGKKCPVVKDTGMSHSSSLNDLLDSGSFPTSRPVSNLDNVDASLKRSYERSLDKLSGPSGGSTLTQRENIIRLIMTQREDEYTEIKQYRVFCGTWNVNGQSASAPVHEWLCPRDGEELYDIYAIGFQELDLSKNAYIFSESAKEEEWTRRVTEALASLHKRARYKRVRLVRLVGMMLVVFIRKDIQEHVYDVHSETVGTGLLGMMGNKGGVGVRFGFYDTSLCFVNAHFAAHVEEYERRNQDFRDINSRMNFGSKEPALGITDHDIVFWIGDLNYRLSDLDQNKAKEMISMNKFDDLMKHDQLCRQMSLKKVFLDYVEGRITFIPTYKYNTGTDEWDSSEKCRTPAWCDRVLWRGSRVKQLKYQSHAKLKLSDHKPVSSVFDVGIKIINRNLYRKVQESVSKKLDRMENDFLPQVALSVTEVNFEVVKFIEPKSLTITISNTGQVPVEFCFINKPGDGNYCKPWLNIEPYKAFIHVGESCDIQLEAYVDKNTAPVLNKGLDRIDDILVLHLESGKDLFVTISGLYLASTFGSSIQDLVNLFGYIREVETAALIDLDHTDRGPVSPRSPSERPLDIPKEIWRLIDHIYTHGMDQEDLFLQPGLHSEIQLIRDSLDTGVPSAITGNIHSVAEALLVFLESLAEPVIPYSHYYKCLESCSNFTLCKQVLQQIPVCHRNVFKYLCAFLRRLLQYTAKNNLDPKLLANQFGGLLLRRPPPPSAAAAAHLGAGVAVAAALSQPPTNPTRKKEEDRKRANFVYHFLLNEYDE